MSNKENEIVFADEKPKPWEMQPDETPLSFEAFAMYRDMGVERSLRKLAKKIGCGYDNVQKWSTRHNWVERVSAYHGHLDQVDLNARLAAREAMVKRQAEQSAQMQNVFMIPFKAIAKRLRERGDDALNLQSLTDKELLELASRNGGTYVQVAKLERLSRGESTDKVENDVNGTLTIQKVEIEIVEPNWDGAEAESLTSIPQDSGSNNADSM